MIRGNFVPIDADAILRIKPSRRGDGDVLAWQPEASGVISVCSAYKLALVEHLEHCALVATSNSPDGSVGCWTKI